MARRGLAQGAEVPPGVAGAVGYRSIGVAETSPAREKGEKKPGIARSFFTAIGLDQHCIAQAATNLRQFGERKLLNLDNGLNDCSVHGNPLLQKDSQINNGCRGDNLGREFLVEVSKRSVAVSPNG